MNITQSAKKSADGVPQGFNIGSAIYHVFIFSQFLFIEGADIPDLGSRPVKIKESLRTVSPQGHLTTTTKTIFKQNGERFFFVYVT